MSQKKIAGGITAGCGGLLLLTSLASLAFFVYVGLEGRGNDEEIAWPASAASCCCSLTFLAMIGVGIYLLVSANKSTQSG